MRRWTARAGGPAGVGPCSGDGTDGVHEVDGVRGGRRSVAKSLAPAGRGQSPRRELRYRQAMADPRFDMAALLERTAELSLAYLRSLPTRHVGARANAADIAARLHVP